MELVNKVLVKETQPNSQGWYDTNEGNIYWFASKEVWSCRDDRVSEEFPVWWLDTNTGQRQLNIPEVSPRFSSFEDALGYINRTNFRYSKGDNFVSKLNEEQLIRFATLLSELP